MNKALWIHFKHFGRLLGKMYLFLTPRKTNGRVPSQQGAPTTCNVTYWDVSQQTYVHRVPASLGCGNRATLRPSVQSGGGGGRGGVEYQNGKWVWPKGEIHPFSRGGGEGFKTNNPQLFSTSNPLRHPELSFSQQHFHSKHIFFFHSPASQSLPEERIFLVPDPLGAPEWCRLRYDTCTTHNVDSIPKFYTARQ